MRRTLSGLAVMVLAATLQPAPAQTMSHEEEAVRNTYARLTTLCEIGRVGEMAINGPVLTAVPAFTIMNITTGSTVSITGDNWSSFVSTPKDSDGVLRVQLVTKQHSEAGTNNQWQTARLYWALSRSVYSETEQHSFGPTVGDVLRSWAPYTYTSYASFTVDATLEGRSTGMHRAIFLFGKDASGKDTIAPVDRFVFGLQDALEPAYPTGFLRSPLRWTEPVSTWLHNNRMPASACSSRGDLCCSHGKCGLSSVDLDDELSRPMIRKEEEK